MLVYKAPLIKYQKYVSISSAKNCLQYDSNGIHIIAKSIIRNVTGLANLPAVLSALYALYSPCSSPDHSPVL